VSKLGTLGIISPFFEQYTFSLPIQGNGSSKVYEFETAVSAFAIFWTKGNKTA
jgi:hypothetical protein